MSCSSSGEGGLGVYKGLTDRGYYLVMHKKLIMAREKVLVKLPELSQLLTVHPSAEDLAHFGIEFQQGGTTLPNGDVYYPYRPRSVDPRLGRGVQSKEAIKMKLIFRKYEVPNFEVLEKGKDIVFHTRVESFETVRKRTFVIKSIEGLGLCLAIYAFGAESVIPKYVVLTEKEFVVLMDDLYKFVIAMSLPENYYSTKIVQLRSNLRMTVEKYPSIRFRQTVFQKLETVVSVTAGELNAFCEMLLTQGFDIFPELMSKISCQSIHGPTGTSECNACFEHAQLLPDLE